MLSGMILVCIMPYAKKNLPTNIQRDVSLIVTKDCFVIDILSLKRLRYQTCMVGRIAVVVFDGGKNCPFYNYSIPDWTEPDGWIFWTCVLFDIHHYSRSTLIRLFIFNNTTSK